MPRTLLPFPLLALLALPALPAALLPGAARAGDDAEPIPDLLGMVEREGHQALAEYVAGYVARIGDRQTASTRLWTALLSEVTFPVEVRGEAAGWIEALSPLQEIDVDDDGVGLRGLLSVWPTGILARDRLTVRCVGADGGWVGPPLGLDGPDEVIADLIDVLYVVHDVDACWLAGGSSLLVAAADADVEALAADPEAPRVVGSWRRPATAAHGLYGGSGEGAALIGVIADGPGDGGVADLFADGGSVGGLLGVLANPCRDARDGKPCPRTGCPRPDAADCEPPPAGE